MNRSGNIPALLERHPRRRSISVRARPGCVTMGAALLVVQGYALAQSPVSTLIGEPRDELVRATAEYNEGQQLLVENPDRARGLFRSAARRLEAIAGLGVINGRLEYNIGNAYLQSGDVGRAILHYLRAQRLMPTDPLLRENLRVARSRCLLSIPPSPRSQILRKVFFWHFETSNVIRTKAMLAAYFLFWLLLIVRLWWRRPALGWGAVASLLAGLALWISVAHDHWSDRHTPAGVVTAMDVVVYKGPGTGYARQFEQPLQPGVEFIARERRSGWFNIELADGKSGWISEQAAALVPIP